MNYLQWNNIISHHFLNPLHAGKDIYLYLNKKDIIYLANHFLNEANAAEIWNDFIMALKNGLPGSTGNIIAKAKYAYDKRNLKSINSIEVTYPPYIAYLVFIILPLIEGIDDAYSANNYYDRLNRFLAHNQINQTINSNDFRNNLINYLWEDLEHWANVKNSGDLGIFKVSPFTNPNWIYVGKIFSQCIFPPKVIKRLPELFLQSGMVPNSYYPPSQVKKFLLLYGSAIQLSNNILAAIRNDSNELGQSIIEIVNREYRKWTGETNEDQEEGLTQRVKRNYTIVPLFLQFKINNNDGLVSFSFRTFSSNDYPEDLKFENYENIYERNRWSKTLQFKFKESFELKDDYNKWVAKFPARDVRLFVNAGTYQLSTDYWIEADTLLKTDPMYLLCKNENSESIRQWGKSFKSGDFRMEDLEGLPENYSLFKISNPVIGHPDIPLLTLYTERKIELSGGLKVNFRTFINDFLPEVEIRNSDGTEMVYLQYRNNEEKIHLSKKRFNSNRWLLPEDILLNVDFYIKVENENFSGNEIAYSISSANDKAIKINDLQLPKRDLFGKCIEYNVTRYCVGSNIINPEKSSIRHYSPFASLFLSIKQSDNEPILKVAFSHHSGNLLCSFLALKNTLTTEEFFRAFEFYYSRQFFESQEGSDFNLTKIKQSSLNFYDYAGILDYNYETKRIVVNRPQLIFIPAAKGRKVLLIGARDTSLLKAIINTAPNYKLQVEITKQFSSNERLLLPDVITLKSFGKPSENYGENDLIAFAKELGIKFSNDYFPQIALQDYSSGIKDYASAMQQSDENDYGWARRIFNPESLIFERTESSTFNKSLSMIEYKLNEYTYYYKFWKEGKCYQVDRNWGKYLVLNWFKKNVILFDNILNRVAIPLETPLPRLLSESIILLSGLAPDFRKIDGNNYRVYENIPGIFTENLFNKLGQQPINKALK